MPSGLASIARLLALQFILSFWIPQLTLAAGPEQVNWESLVLKVVVTRSDGSRELGSAVPLSTGQVVTNCHVVREARHIEVEWLGNTFRAESKERDAYRDLCLLNVPGLTAQPTPMVELGQTRVGLEVVAAGYSGGHFAAHPGKVTGLFSCECDGGKVIRTSAPFDHGASGGGLFDRQGRLVGILTFKATAGNTAHFALPVGWLRHLADNSNPPVARTNTFWEQPGKESGYFLTACDLGARENWPALKQLAGEWTAQEPFNPEAWMALGRARQGLRMEQEAASAYQKVLMLDSTHSEAEWALQQLEIELGQNLTNASGV